MLPGINYELGKEKEDRGRAKRGNWKRRRRRRRKLVITSYQLGGRRSRRVIEKSQRICRIEFFIVNLKTYGKAPLLYLKKYRSKFAGVSFSFCYMALPPLVETRRDAFNAYSLFHWRPPPSFSLSYSIPPPLPSYSFFSNVIE